MNYEKTFLENTLFKKNYLTNKEKEQVIKYFDSLTSNAKDNLLKVIDELKTSKTVIYAFEDNKPAMVQTDYVISVETAFQAYKKSLSELGIINKRRDYKPVNREEYVYLNEKLLDDIINNKCELILKNGRLSHLKYLIERDTARQHNLYEPPNNKAEILCLQENKADNLINALTKKFSDCEQYNIAYSSCLYPKSTIAFMTLENDCIIKIVIENLNNIKNNSICLEKYYNHLTKTLLYNGIKHN